MVDMSKYDAQEIEGGECPDCMQQAKLHECIECGLKLWNIDCLHYYKQFFICGVNLICRDCYNEMTELNEEKAKIDFAELNIFGRPKKRDYQPYQFVYIYNGEYDEPWPCNTALEIKKIRIELHRLGIESARVYCAPCEDSAENGTDIVSLRQFVFAGDRS